MWHKAVGGPLHDVPEESWLRVVQEKHPDMLHLLQFPYNGEPPKVRSTSLLRTRFTPFRLLRFVYSVPISSSVASY
jgi:hypothetical protein